MIFKFLGSLKRSYGSFFYLLAHKKIWLWALLPLMINVIIILILVRFGFAAYGTMFGDFKVDWLLIGESIDISFWKKCLAYIYLGLKFSFQAVFMTIIFSCVYYVLSSVAASPCYDILSEKVENIERSLNWQTGEISWVARCWVPIKNACVLLMLELFICMLGFPLNWIPVAGSLLYVLMIGYILALNATSYSFERRHLGAWSILKKSMRCKESFLGLGAFCILTLMIPFLGVILMPLCVIAGTREFLALEKTNWNAG